MQCKQGVLYSYREAESNLEKLTVHRRRVNNHNQIKVMTTQVGAVLAQEHLKPPAAQECAPPAQETVVQIDGGHIPTQDQDKRSFEALSAVVYRPERIRTIDQHHCEIESKSCALSAQDDDLSTMKTYLLHAALKQCMNKETVVTALADGALNCWSVISSLTSECKQLICILDWFHIAKKFQNVRNAVDETYTESLERVKWTLWHGQSAEALSQLKILITNVTQTNKQKKLEELSDYLSRNQVYLVNYRNENSRANHLLVKWLNLTSNRLSMPDIRRVEKCNGQGREFTMSYKFEGKWLATNGAVGGKSLCYLH